MNLTSPRRIKYALGVASTAQDAILSRLIGLASKQISYELRRTDQAGGNGFELKSRIEYVNPKPSQRRFHLRAYPINSVSAVYVDATGRYDGSESLIASDQYLVDADSRSLTFLTDPFQPDWSGFLTSPKGMRITYTAGLAADPVISSWTKEADVGGTLAAGNYIYGQTSGSVGYLTARAAGTLSYECLAGEFVAETVAEYSTWHFDLQSQGPGAATGVSTVLTANTAQSLAEAHPALVEACEMHVRFLKTNRDSFENIQVTTDGATKTSRADLKNRYRFLPEILDAMEFYRNKLVIA